MPKDLVSGVTKIIEYRTTRGEGYYCKRTANTKQHNINIREILGLASYCYDYEENKTIDKVIESIINCDKKIVKYLLDASIEDQA